MRAPASNGKVIGSSSQCTSRLPFRVIKTFFSPFMSKHDKAQRLAPKKPLDIFIVLPSPLNFFFFFLHRFLGWASGNRAWLFQGERCSDLVFILQAPSCRSEPARVGSLHIFKGGSRADVIRDSLYKSEPRLIQKICSFCSSCEPHNVILLLICWHLDNMTVPR